MIKFQFRHSILGTIIPITFIYIVVYISWTQNVPVSLKFWRRHFSIQPIFIYQEYGYKVWTYLQWVCPMCWLLDYNLRLYQIIFCRAMNTVPINACCNISIIRENLIQPKCEHSRHYIVKHFLFSLPYGKFTIADWFSIFEPILRTITFSMLLFKIINIPRWYSL